jgi:hypothetical protein
MGQADPLVTWKHYARLFDRLEVAGRIRDAQASLDRAEASPSTASAPPRSPSTRLGVVGAALDDVADLAAKVYNDLSTSRSPLTGQKGGGAAS